MTLQTLSKYRFPQGDIKCYYHTGSIQHALDIIKNTHLFGSIPSKLKDKEDLKIQYEGLDNSLYLKSRIDLCQKVVEETLHRPIQVESKNFSEKIATMVKDNARDTHG